MTQPIDWLDYDIAWAEILACFDYRHDLNMDKLRTLLRKHMMPKPKGKVHEGWLIKEQLSPNQAWFATYYDQGAALVQANSTEVEGEVIPVLIIELEEKHDDEKR